MGGAAGGSSGATYGGAGGHVARAARYDPIYGAGWQEAVLKTLEQELKERGIEPKIGDDDYQVVPTPRLIGDRVALGMVCALFAFLGICACWAWWEYLPDDGSPFYTQRTRSPSPR